MTDKVEYAIGWFGVPNKVGGKTHIIFKSSGKVVCGARINPKAQFQWCANGFSFNPECESCKKYMDNITKPKPVELTPTQMKARIAELESELVDRRSEIEGLNRDIKIVREGR